MNDEDTKYAGYLGVLSRRRLLKQAAIGGVALGAAALIGCGRRRRRCRHCVADRYHCAGHTDGDCNPCCGDEAGRVFQGHSLLRL